MYSSPESLSVTPTPAIEVAAIPIEFKVESGSILLDLYSTLSPVTKK